jgi:16S rRNA (cytidine1402-2'-O)-methyltransferase
MGSLYIVPTPIGNLEDITLRALRILRESILIAAEDTRVTAHLLAHYQITTPLISYHEHNKLSRVPTILEKLTRGDVALVSDAGMPGVSDPGYELICAAIQQGVTVIPLPGASAALTAAVASGLPLDAFLVLGFLPRKSNQRRAAFVELCELPFTLVLYEAPHRLLETLKDALEILGDRNLLVARELTKLYEELWRGTLQAACEHFDRVAPRGEITIVIEGHSPVQAAKWDEDRVRQEFARMLAAGQPRSEAARTLATLSGWPRRDVYDIEGQE